MSSCTSNDGTANYSYDPTGQLIAASYTGVHRLYPTPGTPTAIRPPWAT